MSTVSKEILQERQPFDVAWRTIDGLKIRYATDGKGDEKIVLFSPWPESIFAFVSVWPGLTRQFEVLAIDLPGFGRSEARDDLFAPQTMGEFIAKALDAFGLTSVHAVGLDIGSPSVLFAALARPELFRSLIVGAGASTYPLVAEGALKSMIEAEALPQLNAVDVVVEGGRITRFDPGAASASATLSSGDVTLVARSLPSVRLALPCSGRSGRTSRARRRSRLGSA